MHMLPSFVDLHRLLDHNTRVQYFSQHFRQDALFDLWLHKAIEIWCYNYLVEYIIFLFFCQDLLFLIPKELFDVCWDHVHTEFPTFLLDYLDLAKACRVA